MTSSRAALATHRAVPSADTEVLVNRPLNPAIRRPPSAFGDDWWDVGPGLFEAHIADAKWNFGAIPDRFRLAAKHYVWQLINHDQPGYGTRRRRRLALRSIGLGLPRLGTFLHWLDAHGVARIADTAPADLDDYAADVAAMEATANSRAGLLQEVRRLWSYRSLLPADAQLPETPPWSGERPSDVRGGATRPRENRTRRIASETMQTLLMWSLRFVEDFAEDILAAHREHQRLRGRSPGLRYRSRSYTGHLTRPGEAEEALRAWLHRLGETGAGLPSKLGHGGQRQVDWAHLCRLFDLSEDAFRTGRPSRRVVDAAKLPLGGPAVLDIPITGLLHGRPWRTTPVGYSEAADLIRLLSTAAAVVITYLTGMRPGEVLNLERGCIRHDPTTSLWFISGKHWKTARDRDGNKIAQGEQRPDPWTTNAPVAAAVAALERLHPQRLLFTAHAQAARPRARRAPTTQAGRRGPNRFGQGRTNQELTKDIAALTQWINHFAVSQNLPAEQIPAEPHGAITLSRFRRTLAWHIVRRPRGLIAGAIQYGHVHAQITLGYAGTYESGFPDEHAYEDWLHRLDTLAENHRQLARGEHVSGPAAHHYSDRISAAQQKFAGRVLTSLKHARAMVTNPLLQIYPGRGMTCVFDPAKALCQLRAAEDDARRTPDQDDCRPNCQNIAYTDRNIAEVRRHAAALREVVDDRLAPSIRHRRDRAELHRIRAIVDRHDHGE